MRNPSAQPRATRSGLARLSATIDADLLVRARHIARLSGYRFSFSAYVNDLLARDVQTKSALLNARP